MPRLVKSTDGDNVSSQKREPRKIVLPDRYRHEPSSNESNKRKAGTAVGSVSNPERVKVAKNKSTETAKTLIELKEETFDESICGGGLNKIVPQKKAVSRTRVKGKRANKNAAALETKPICDYTNKTLEKSVSANDSEIVANYTEGDSNVLSKTEVLKNAGFESSPQSSPNITEVQNDNESILSDKDEQSQQHHGAFPLPTPSLVEQFNNCLLDYYTDDFETYNALTKQDCFPSLSEFFFGGETPRYEFLEEILDFTDDSIGCLQFGLIKKYMTFLNSGFQTCERFKKCLKDNDLSKKEPEVNLNFDGSHCISETTSSLLISIRNGSALVTTLSPLDKDDILTALINENHALSQKVAEMFTKLTIQSKDLAELKLLFKQYAHESSEHINKLATNRKEERTQATVQHVKDYGVGAWFPSLRSPTERIPNHDEYYPEEYGKDIVIKRHKEEDLSKKMWWVRLKSVEKATAVRSKHMSTLFKMTFSNEEYGMLRIFFGQTEAEARASQFTIPTNLKNAAEDLAAFIAYVSKYDESQKATQSMITAAGIDSQAPDAKVKYQRWLGANAKEEWTSQMHTMFYNSNYQTKLKDMRKQRAGDQSDLIQSEDDSVSICPISSFGSKKSKRKRHHDLEMDSSIDNLTFVFDQ